MTTTMKPAALHEATLALTRAHDALASINGSGAYRDILSDMRTTLCALEDALKAAKAKDAGNVR